jgi:lysozyme family protein
MTDDDIIARILAFEGGFMNHALDRGGATNFGITASELGRARALGRPATVAEVEALTRGEAASIFQRNYIVGPGYGRVTDGNLRMIVVDAAVLHGAGRATKWLQQALGVTVDGVIGTQTTDALAAPAGARAGRDLLAIRFKFIGAILKGNPKQVVFAAGWLNRVADLLKFA